MPDLVRRTVTDGIGRIRLADPAHRNALSQQLSNELAAAVACTLEEGARVIVLSAEPPVFCAGGSLDALISRDIPLTDMYHGFLALAAAPVPTIAVVGAPAIGAGVNLPLACDVVLVSPSATFDPRFLDVGIHPGGGHLWRLARRVGVQGVNALVLCGDVLTGAEAVEHGLAWRCVPDDELDGLATRFAERVASRSGALVRRTKESVAASVGLARVEDAMAIELRAQQWSIEQPEFEATVRRVRDRLAR
jgi:enoyl-CoA hydratase